MSKTGLTVCPDSTLFTLNSRSSKITTVTVMLHPFNRLGFGSDRRNVFLPHARAAGHPEILIMSAFGGFERLCRWH